VTLEFTEKTTLDPAVARLALVRSFWYNSIKGRLPSWVSLSVVAVPSFVMSMASVVVWTSVMRLLAEAKVPKIRKLDVVRLWIAKLPRPPEGWNTARPWLFTSRSMRTPPRSMELPVRYKSRKRLEADPRSYTFEDAGIM